MRTRYLLTALMLVGFSAMLHAQTERESFLVGGGLSLRTGKSSSNFALTPNFGYFFANNFALGGQMALNFAKDGNVTNNTVGFGPFARYYFGTTSTKPFIVTEFDFLSRSTKTGDVKITNSGIGFLFGMGFAAFINETVAVEGISGYNYSKFKDADGSGGFSLRFGLQIYLNNKNVGELKSNVLGQ